MNPQPKLKRISEPEYGIWTHDTRSCVITGEISTQYQDVVLAHQTIIKRLSAKGTSQKDHDIWGLPLIAWIHQQEHDGKDIWGDRDKARLQLSIF